MTRLPLIWLSDAEVERLLDPAALVERVEALLRDVAAGRAVDARPLRIDAIDHAANYAAFPAYSPDYGIATVKALSGAEGNPAQGHAAIDAAIVTMDAATGALVAIMEGRTATALRTAAATAVAVRSLGPQRDATLAIIGTGAQMLAHARVFAAIGACRDIIVASAQDDPTRATAAAALIEARAGLSARPASCAEAAARADILILASWSRAPLVTEADLKPDAIIASVGPFIPGATELDPAIVASAPFVMSDLRLRLQDHWRCDPAPLGAMFDQVHDLGEWLLAGSQANWKIGRRVFLSDGRAIEDLAAASLVLERARAEGVAGLRLR